MSRELTRAAEALVKASLQDIADIGDERSPLPVTVEHIRELARLFLVGHEEGWETTEPVAPSADADPRHWVDFKNSTNLKSMCYGLTSAVLSIRFKNGGEYDHEGVPEDLARGLQLADETPGFSPGQFYHTYIRGKFVSNKVS